SPARRDTDHMGADLVLAPGTSEVPVVPGHEHALVVIEGTVEVDGHRVDAGHLGYLAPGRQEVVVEAHAPARALLIGGVPFPDPVLMWWNYVARTRDEVTEAHGSWRADDGRFPSVASPLERLVTGP